MAMIDSHCHLADDAFVKDLPDVIGRAQAAGLSHALCILAAENPTEAERARELARIWPALRFGVGLHPHQAGQFSGRAADVVPLVRGVIAALPEARAVSIQSGWPTPQADVIWRDKTMGDVPIFGITPPYQDVQDYRIAVGRPLTDIDVLQRQPVIVVGAEIADKLFENVEAVGRDVRILGERFTIVGVVQPKGRVLGQSFDAFVLMPLPRFEMIYGRRNTTTISVKMGEAVDVAPAMAKAEEAMRIAHGLRPGEDNNFSVETADALVNFWKTLTKVLFSVIPAVVAIGIIVGGIVIMNIMLMAVNERTREIGIRKAVGATRSDISRQFFVETITLSSLGGALGVLGGWTFALVIATASPLPARVSYWSVIVALALGASVGVLFGVYPARRAARLDPITALRAE